MTRGIVHTSASVIIGKKDKRKGGSNTAHTAKTKCEVFHKERQMIMRAKEVIEHLEEVFKCLQEEVDTEELTDFAREQACLCIESALQYIKENED